MMMVFDVLALDGAFSFSIVFFTAPREGDCDGRGIRSEMAVRQNNAPGKCGAERHDWCQSGLRVSSVSPISTPPPPPALDRSA